MIGSCSTGVQDGEHSSQPECGELQRYFFSRGHSLVVLGRQVDSVLVPGGGQVLLQTLDLLGVFLMADRLTHVHHLFPRLWFGTSRQAAADPP